MKAIIWAAALCMVPIITACGGMGGFIALLVILYILSLPFLILAKRWRTRRNLARYGNEWGIDFDRFPGRSSY